MLLSQLQNDGLQLYVDGEQLAVKSNTELTVQQRGLLKRYKRQLLAELAHAKDKYKTTIRQINPVGYLGSTGLPDRPLEMFHQYRQRPDETEEQYHDRVIDESFN